MAKDNEKSYMDYIKENKLIILVIVFVIGALLIWFFMKKRGKKSETSTVSLDSGSSSKTSNVSDGTKLKHKVNIVR